jgi:acyl-CoA thioester hydrolase
MPRINIELPENFSFSCQITVRISDINYGNHAGNDSILSMVHEARMQFLRSLDYTELKMEGYGLIMSDAALIFKQELFYGEQVHIHVKATDFSKVGFDIVYKLEKITGENMVTVAIAKTAMICYDYTAKKICPLPENAKKKLMDA